MKVLTRFRVGVLLVFFVLLAVVAAFSGSKIQDVSIDLDQYNALVAEGVYSEADLHDWFLQEQSFYMIITPPDPDFILKQPSANVLVFDPKAFSPDFTNRLIPAYENSVQLFPVEIRIDYFGYTYLYNAEGKLIYSLTPASDYDLDYYAKTFYPNLYSGLYSAETVDYLKRLYSPTRIRIFTRLLPFDSLEPYLYTAARLEAVQNESLSSSFEGGGMELMRSQEASTSIMFESIARQSNGLKIVIGYPDEFTNRLEIYSSVNLKAFQWSFVATNLSTVGTNEISYLYTNAYGETGASNLTIGVGNADLESDGDGLKDAHEHYFYRTRMDSIDSDNDGLVDGYNGVVSTNAYAGGISTNGSTVIGELSLGTTPYLADTDGDAMNDGVEIVNRTDPLNPNYPPSVSGIISYNGRQTGSVWVVAVTSSGSWSTNSGVKLTSTGAYQVPNLLQTNYYLKAWRDTDGNGLTNATEAFGVLTGNPIVVTNKVTSKNITLTDPDYDADTLPDWWEVRYFGNISTWGATNDPDADTYSNKEEFDADTNPTNGTSHPANIEGVVYYAGPQTGTVYVIASTSSVSWIASGIAVASTAGTYAISHLTTNRSYWVRAYKDSNGSTMNDYFEATGEYVSNPVLLITNTIGINITLANPDTDEDTLPDYWEMQYGLDPFFGGQDGANAWWKMDSNGNSTNVLDATASTNHGVLMGSSGSWTYGVMSNALAFDGINDYVEVPDSASLKPNSISLAFWLRPNKAYAAGESGTFISKRDPQGPYGYGVSYENGGIKFFIGDNGSNNIYYPCSLSSGTWYHVAVTYDNCRQEIYLNGILQTASVWNCGMSFGEIDQATNVLRMGASSSTPPSMFYQGRLDDVRVINGAIYSNWVYGIYEQGIDFDNDGLSYWDEYHHATDPLSNDTDSDGMSDGWEAIYNLNPLVADGVLDADSDGLSNFQEYRNGSIPNLSDSDGNGVPDGWDIYGGPPIRGDVNGDGILSVADLTAFDLIVAGYNVTPIALLQADLNGDGVLDSIDRQALQDLLDGKPKIFILKPQAN